MFTFYILQFKFLYTNFQVIYHIRTAAKNLQSVDELLTDCCEKIMERIVKSSDEMQLYELNIQLYDVGRDMLELEFAVSGKVPDVQAFMQTIENIDCDVTIQHLDDEIKCTVRIPYNEGDRRCLLIRLRYMSSPNPAEMALLLTDGLSMFQMVFPPTWMAALGASECLMVK